ncbi:intradiol ring-cleavage dioxygenase [Caballeronia arationis]|jgi:catechol 1,2-dioxygenase|uniref:Hydroxyquinol 1,2-dioxygenase n=1 Tax=Caballeronia arationis TaxID=1777142 RepID=A0A7Z7IET2_9BURK|nr:intradiol ring-cleavage dioxygenase [Caballeronia arationis]SAK97500.1 intradiol ring-cleavage dioxygenase [Caballeronia arationis]SOE88551.1 hydroxyquinol 1,2-dioxygenase [Caballeronia arationis]
MKDLTSDTLTATVTDSFSACPDPRTKEIITALVRHLHDFAREVRLTHEEWRHGIEFLTATGRKCDGIRQEFILLSDTLGLSIVLDAINQRHEEASTESSLLGPFYRDGVREAEFGADIAQTEGEPALFHGRVVDANGTPVASALIEVWQTAANGMYEGQDPDQPEGNLRGRFRSNAAGEYAFRSLKPTSYPIPTDGPVGRMLIATGRHPMRPAHVHFKIEAHGYETLTTALFSSDDPYVDSDAVFGVKSSLVVDYVPKEGRERFFDVERDFVLIEKERT